MLDGVPSYPADGSRQVPHGDDIEPHLPDAHSAEVGGTVRAVASRKLLDPTLFGRIDDRKRRVLASSWLGLRGALTRGRLGPSGFDLYHD